MENVRAMKVILIAWTCFMNFCVSAQWSNVEYQVILFTKYDESFAYDNE